MGTFFPADTTALPSLPCGGVGEQRVTFAQPAGPDVGQGADGDRVNGFVVLGAAVGGTGVPEQAEGDGVAPSFGEEVAAEAEHVCPATQPAVHVRFGVKAALTVAGCCGATAPVGLGEAAKVPTGVNEAGNVVAFRIGVVIDRGRVSRVKECPAASVALVAYFARYAATLPSVSSPLAVLILRTSTCSPQAISQPCGRSGCGGVVTVICRTAA